MIFYIHKPIQLRVYASRKNINNYFKYNVRELEREVLVPRCIEEELIPYNDKKVLVNVMGLNERNIEFLLIYGYVSKERVFRTNEGVALFAKEIPKSDIEGVKKAVLNYYNFEKPLSFID
ncbi:Uncharacterised protein [Candidatus Tiddalikarchaeum anstoanum]|nr:Uncharacterised protein [Candidatus Tiddalikarchaeum anstoanum]